MVKEELVQRSSVKALEKMVGGLAAGELGIISSPSGLGKTSVLVQIALYKLLQGKKIVHVSFTQQTSYVLAWYEDIFAELVKNKNLANERELMEELVKYRVLLNFNQDGVNSDTIRASLKALIQDGGFNAEAIIIDGFNFTHASLERMRTLKAFAKEAGLYLWYSCTVAGPHAYDTRNIPNVLAPVEHEIDAVFVLDPKADYINLSLSKNRALPVDKSAALKLDPKTLLILEE